MDPRFHTQSPVIAFVGHQRIASGSLSEVVLEAHPWTSRLDVGPVLVFDDVTSQLVELDFRGSAADAANRLLPASASASASPEISSEGTVEESSSEKRGPGRPKMGVVAREVTLLPRHWEWLNQQSGGASVALRKLVEDARKTHVDRDRKRQAADAVHRFLHALAGDLPQFEEVTRAFHASDFPRMTELMATWPEGVREHVERLVGRVGA